MLGAELRKARAAAGLTQLQLALKAELDPSYISLLEHDRKSPTLKSLFRICRVLNIRPHTLIARVERSMERDEGAERRPRGSRP